MSKERTIIFLDTEFTGLTEDAELMSLGMTTLEGETLYFERIDFDAKKVTRFVAEHVAPLFDAPKEDRLTRKECQARLLAWLQQFEFPKVLVDSPWDVAILKELFSDQPGVAKGGLQKALPRVEFELYPADRSNEDAPYLKAFTLYFEANPGKLHHALHDAQAMRLGWMAEMLEAEET